ncbi:MAG: hypothetical protein AAGG48_11765 [Planctomycetota bacterium]
MDQLQTFASVSIDQTFIHNECTYRKSDNSQAELVSDEQGTEPSAARFHLFYAEDEVEALTED